MAPCTRREFLQDSVLAAAVAAALPAGSLLAADKKKRQRPKKSPGERLHVGIVGAGGRGGDHIGEFLDNPNTEITYIVDADAKIGAQRAEAVSKPCHVVQVAEPVTEQVQRGSEKLHRHEQIGRELVGFDFCGTPRTEVGYRVVHDAVK